MPSVQIRDVPDDLHQALKDLAKLKGQSLNAFLLDELRRVAKLGHNSLILKELHDLPGKRPPPGEGTRIIRAMRDAIDAVR